MVLQRKKGRAIENLPRELRQHFSKSLHPSERRARTPLARASASVCSHTCFACRLVSQHGARLAQGDARWCCGDEAEAEVRMRCHSPLVSVSCALGPNVRTDMHIEDAVWKRESNVRSLAPIKVHALRHGIRHAREGIPVAHQVSTSIQLVDNHTTGFPPVR